MMRTTIDLDPLVLAELKRRQQAEGKTLGELVSELLAPALRAGTSPRGTPDFNWPSQDMGALLNLEDKDAVWARLDAS
jgi:hypothetical protein